MRMKYVRRPLHSRMKEGTPSKAAQRPHASSEDVEGRGELRHFIWWEMEKASIGRGSR